MSKSNINTPVEAIRHENETRAAIPTQELAGTEPQPKTPKADYDTFRHEFNRGCDPELYWLGKYTNDSEETQNPQLQIDIRSLYVHEDIKPEMIIGNLYRITEQKKNEAQGTLFDNDDPAMRTSVEQEFERIAEYYKHSDKWQNRLIQGDSLLVMNSLLQRENMAGKVQCIYIDPPYGIKYGSNWQMKLNSRDVKDNDENLCGEPEMIKAYRDTWELGIHSYLSYLRDRLVLARELLTQSGSVFVQISDDNVHLVRNIMDEVFGSENFVSLITFQTKVPLRNKYIANVSDYIVWYARDIENFKYRALYEPQLLSESPQFSLVELTDGTIRSITTEERMNPSLLPKGSKVFTSLDLASSGRTESCVFDYEYKGKRYSPTKGKSWKTNLDGMKNLDKANRFYAGPTSLRYKLYHDDFPVKGITNLWLDSVGVSGKEYVVQTDTKVIQRCILMTTDPGDLVLDPTCGSGTTAYVAEQWGRRWITVDTSRIAINIAKKRLTTAVFPYYELFDKENGDIRQGFIYDKVPHITVKSIAQNEPATEEILYDKPKINDKRMRVSGPFTVETLQNHNVLSPESLEQHNTTNEEARTLQERIFGHLQSSGIRNGDKSQQTIFYGLEPVADAYLNAKGYYKDENGEERIAYFHIGPKFGTVSERAVSQAISTMLNKAKYGGAKWLVILGFSFQDDLNIEEANNQNLGLFTVSKVRMHDDLMQDGLLKKDKNAGSFIIIGEPDIALVKDEGGKTCHTEIRGLDIYDPITDIVKARSVDDIAYWEIDTNYNGTHFVVSSLHFCGDDKNAKKKDKAFGKWEISLEKIKSQMAKIKAEHTLRLEFNPEYWDTLYGFESEPIPYEPGRKVCVRVVSQFGEEASKVIEMK